MSLALSICVLLIPLIQAVNGVQFFSSTTLFLSSLSLIICICAAVLSAGGSASPVIVKVPFINIYASL